MIRIKLITRHLGKRFLSSDYKNIVTISAQITELKQDKTKSNEQQSNQPKDDDEVIVNQETLQPQWSSLESRILFRKSKKNTGQPGRVNLRPSAWDAENV